LRKHVIWGFHHVVGFRRRHVGASIQEAWTTSLDSVRTALDADPAHDRLVLLRPTSQELGPTREAVVDAAVQRLELSQKQAAEPYTLAEAFETNPRSVWGYGDPTPSPDDARLTLRLCVAADLLDVPLLDHLIAGDADRYYSFREAGLIERSPAWS
jgi:hypothetical protein